MSNHTEQLDSALMKLAEGMSLADVQRAHPEIADELASYGKTLGMLKRVAAEKPSEAHFERLLSKPLETEKVESPFSFVSFFSVYREALVFPALTLLIVASAAFLPGRQPGEVVPEGGAVPTNMDASIEGATLTAPAPTGDMGDARMMQFSAPAETGPAEPMLMKSIAPEAPLSTTTEDTASSTPETEEETPLPTDN